MEIIDYRKVKFPEGCESIRGFSGLVQRYQEVSLKGNLSFIFC